MDGFDPVKYFKGDRPPPAASVLTSTSKFLNSPLYRDIFSQFGLRLVGTDVPNTYLIPDMVRATEEMTDVARVLAAEKQAKPEFAAWLDKRHLSRWRAEELKEHGPGTLGRRIHDFLTQTGMEMDFMSHAVPQSDYEYFKRRRIQDHDIEHMVTGLNTSPVGEIALIAFNNIAALNYFSPQFWQEISPGFLFLLTTSLMRASLHYPKTVVPYFEGMAIAHKMAMRQKQPFFFTEWEPYLDWTIADIREELHLTDAPPDGAWADSYVAEGIAPATAS